VPAGPCGGIPLTFAVVAFGRMTTLIPWRLGLVLLLISGVVMTGALAAPSEASAQDVASEAPCVVAGDGFSGRRVGRLVSPQGVAVDSAGNVFVADREQVLRIDPTGAETQLTTGLVEPKGIDVDSAGNVFVAGSGANPVVRIDASGAQSIVPTVGVATAQDVAVDAAGNVFVADPENSRVVRVDPSGVQTTLVSGLTWVRGVEVDAVGNVFIVDWGANRLIRVDPAGVQTTLNTGIGRPRAVAVDSAGNVFVADEDQVVRIDSSGASVALPMWGLVYPEDLFVDDAGNVFLADWGNYQIFASGPICGASPSLDPQCSVFGPPGVAVFKRTTPSGIAVDGSGNMYLSDRANNSVVRVDPSGVQTTVISGIAGPHGLDVDGAGNVFVAQPDNNSVVRVDPSGVQTTVGSGLARPSDVAVDNAGNVFIADTSNNRVVRVDPSGVQTTIGSGLALPTGVAVDAAGNVFIADLINNRVVRVDPSGVQTQLVTPRLVNPTGLDVDAAGNVYITGRGKDARGFDQVMRIDAAGGQSSIVGPSLVAPDDVAVDAAGNVFVRSQNRVNAVGPRCADAPAPVDPTTPSPAPATPVALRVDYPAGGFTNAPPPPGAPGTSSGAFGFGGINPIQAEPPTTSTESSTTSGSADASVEVPGLANTGTTHRLGAMIALVLIGGGSWAQGQRRKFEHDN